MSETTPNPLAAALRAEFVDSKLEEKINAINRRHALIHQQSGGLVVITEDLENSRVTNIRFDDPKEMALLYPETVTVGSRKLANGSAGADITKKLGQAWLENPRRRFYDGIGLYPRNAPETHYNLWRGFTVEPRPGNWDLFREHISLIVGENTDHLRYVIGWLAETVQHPEKRIGTALAFRGGQGIGKSTFARWFGSIFGPHFLHLSSEQQLVGRFNAHMHDAVIVFADEAVWAGGKAGVGTLKRMVTEDTLTIERKNVDILTGVPNRIHLMIASNEEWVVPAGLDDRRFAIFETSDRRKNDSKFFGAVQKQLFEDGGLSAMLHDLLEMKSTVDLRRVPQTFESQDQKVLSMSPIEQWWYEQLQRGSMWRADAETDEGFVISRDYVYQSYTDTLEKAHSRVDRGTETRVGMFLRRVMPPDYPRSDRKRYDKKAREETQTQWAQRDWVFPSLEVCREIWAKRHVGVVWEDAAYQPPTRDA